MTERPPPLMFFKWRDGLYMSVADYDRGVSESHFKALVLKKSPQGGTTKEGYLTIFSSDDPEVLFISPEEVP